MKIAFYYLDFLARYFDIKSKTSRQNFWTVLLMNTVLMVLLTSVGLAIPKGTPLQIYIGFSSVIATPLIVPYVTIMIRRLNDVGKKRWLIILMLIPMGLGMVLLLFFCAQKSVYGTTDDFSMYQSFDEKIGVIKGIFNNAITVYPFVYLVYVIIKLLFHSGILGVNIALLSITLIICVLTIVDLTTSKLHSFLGLWKFIKRLTALSSAMLTIILYQDTQNFMEAVVIVYLFFYVMIIPAILAFDAYKLVKCAHPDLRR